MQETITFQENGDGRVKASPLAKKMAAEKGIALTQVSGSGDGGRIVRRDIENFVPGTETSEVAPVINIPAYIGEESFEEVAVSQMRKTIAGRLSQNKFTAPHFYLTISVDMSNAMDARKRMNENSPVKISFNDIIVKHQPWHYAGIRVNSSWLGDRSASTTMYISEWPWPSMTDW